MTRGDVQETVLATGSLEAQSTTSIGAQVSGTIQTLPVKLGDTVKAGDLIAQIDSTNQQNAVQSAEASLANMQAQLQAKQADLIGAQAALDRANKLAPQKLVSDADLLTAQSGLAAAQAAIGELNAQISQAQLAVDDANLALSRTKIVAPTDGTIVAVLVTEGQSVNANQTSPTIVKIANLDTMLIKAQISEADITKVTPGQKATFTILGDPNTRIAATLLSVEPAPDAITTADNGLSSTDNAVYYNGLFSVANPDHRLRIAMTAQVTIVNTAKGALTLPASVLGSAGRNGYYRVGVYVQASGKVKPAEVKVGLNNNITAEISSGLNEGDLVVAPRTSAQRQRRPAHAAATARRRRRQWASSAVAAAAAVAGRLIVATPLISLRGLTRRFVTGAETVTVLDDINLDIEAGDMVAIIGQSGSGKSTLMNILGCLDKASAGTYSFAGRDISKLGPDELAALRRENFGFIFQRYQLLADLNAVENTAMPAIYAGVENTARTARATELLNRLGLGDRLRNRPGALSGGQQQRVSVARALMNGGEVILADEPTGALDSKSGKELMELLQELNREGHTIIIVTHDAAIARQTDRMIEISDGKIIADTRNDAAGAMRDRRAADPASAAGNPLQWLDRGTEALRMAVRSMTAHKLRTFLTMLGIIIGIASVVSVVALGQGSQQAVLENIASIGTNTINIYPGTGFGDRGQGRIRTLLPSDADAIGTQSYADSVTPRVSTNQSILFNSVAVNAQVSGVGVDYFRVNGSTLTEGTGFDAAERRRPRPGGRHRHQRADGDLHPRRGPHRPSDRRRQGAGAGHRRRVGHLHLRPRQLEPDNLPALYHRDGSHPRPALSEPDHRPCRRQFGYGHRRERNHRSADAPARRQGRFLPAEHQHYPRHHPVDQPDADAADLGHRRDLADCRRHRGDEHHAGVGEGADP